MWSLESRTAMGFLAASLMIADPGFASATPALPVLGVGALPVEVAFLANADLPIPVLLGAARDAALAGVTAETILLTEGLISAERYYRSLATHLGMPFAEKPLRPAIGNAFEAVSRTGVAELDSNPHGWRYLAAPRGEALRAFLCAAEDFGEHAPAQWAITSPERLEALIRHRRRRDVVKTASHTLPDWDSALSAREGVSTPQALLLLAGAAAFCAAAWTAPERCIIAFEMVFTLAFLLVVILRFTATAASPAPVNVARARQTPDAGLPIYTIIVPLFREARVVKRLVQSLDNLDYPRAKLDIILVVEAADRGTLDTISAMRLPGCYRTIVAPPGRPRTKPRALNVALQFARGQFVVIFDAEDEPERDQLRAAVQRFETDPGVACLQARLAIDNIEDSWLTAMFAVEYAALFHVINPGLAALGLPIPLGGTSNHFRTEALRRVNGWDAWNVTEDIDLGIRLARFGLRVGSLDSTTFEEAPNTLDAWLKQRCRWMKGWMVTLGTHSREPRRFWHELGPVKAGTVSTMLFGTIASSLLGPLCCLVLAWRTWSGTLFWSQSRAETWWNVASCLVLSLGVVSAIWPMLLGLRRRGLPGLARWLGALPLYFLLLSLATWQAAFEVLGRPHAWTKTEHGRAKRRFGATLPG